MFVFQLTGERTKGNRRGGILATKAWKRVYFRISNNNLRSLVQTQYCTNVTEKHMLAQIRPELCPYLLLSVQIKKMPQQKYIYVDAKHLLPALLNTMGIPMVKREKLKNFSFLAKIFIQTSSYSTHI